MATTFHDLLKKYRESSLSEAEKGTKFEELMRAYLLALPKYRGMLAKVWLWKDFPYRTDFGSGHDLGIDLVALTVTGEYWAVQCKCYAENAYISKEAVDTFLSTSGKRFSDGLLEPKRFSRRLWIATTDNWSANAEASLVNQVPPVMKVGLADLVGSPVDWEQVEARAHGGRAGASRPPNLSRTPYEHQQEAIAAARTHFAAHDRGKLIMACGTGKTYTSLKIAEDQVKPTGLVLFLVPSIALLGQTLNEWTANAEKPIRPMCVCSDVEVSRRQKATDDGGFTVEDLAFPASTNTDEIVRQFRQLDLLAKTNGGFRVVFSTYQSLPQVIAAQRELNKEKPHQADFDLVICDEAHRTTGTTARTGVSPVQNAGNRRDVRSPSAFLLVHDNSRLVAKKRLYMTATPRIFNDRIKDDAKREDVCLYSMDDEGIYGGEFYRIGFGKAVEKGLLSDYKVLVLTYKDKIPQVLRDAVTASNGEIKMDDAAKLIGCTNALSKQMVRDSEAVRREDPSLMHKAVAFCGNINASKQVAGAFNALREKYFASLAPEERARLVAIEADHVDGTMGAAARQRKLAWLDSAAPGSNTCHVLSNVKCLSEGVDVPSLDAILFLAAKNSMVDVVQSVGRVMRKAPGKKYGYVIIPVVVPPDMSPEDALDNSDVYNVVWTVLNALRAHDDHFDAEVNKIDLNKNGSGKIIVDVIGMGESGGPQSSAAAAATQDEFDFRAKIYAKMVKKVGTRRYWSLWAEEVARIAARHSKRMKEIISTPGPKRDGFLKFLDSLRENLNPTVSEEEAADMLVQHALTKPVFDAVFEGYDFAASNVVSMAMQKMVDALHEEIPAHERRAMDEFYKSVAERAEGIDNAEGKQRVIYELYDKFFRAAFPKMSEQLGIVYTPVECVDFIINSVEDVLRKEFGQSLTDRDVHVIDPFTGTGTFMTRLLQSGHIKPKDLKRKYTQELHANEIVLLAYYIASVNIESVYHDLVVKQTDLLTPNGVRDSDSVSRVSGEQIRLLNYTPFEGICLTDTFELYEKGDVFETPDFQRNSARVTKQKKSPIRIVVGNPPYSVGQKSANDNAQNAHYPKLEDAIARTYAKNSTAANKNALYDSYIKAFRWATDRLEDGKGIVAFISGAGWLDGNAMDGFRASLEQEFDSIYVFNLRGNCRTSGELRKKEAGNVFGLGSRTPIAITLLVKNDKIGARGARALPNHNGRAVAPRPPCARIFYRDIGDYLSREKKLEIVKNMRSMLDPKMGLVEIHTNAKHDWINQRDGVFDSLIPMEPQKKYDAKSQSAFVVNSRGLETARDAWVYNFAQRELAVNVEKMVTFYNSQLNRSKDELEYDPTKISWSANLISAVSKGERAIVQENAFTQGVYRPFNKQHLYRGDKFINRRGQFDDFFPTLAYKNRIICICGAGVSRTFSCLMTDEIPDVQLMMNGQCFPLYVYAKEEGEQMSLFDKGDDGYRKESGITDFMLERCRTEFGDKITKEDVFYYIYAVLHSPDYRKRFEADLKKSLARIPLCKTGAEFAAFVKAGRKLGDLHCGYESVKPWPACFVDVAATSAALPLEKSPSSPMSPSSPYRITKMRFAKKDNPTDENHNGKLDRWEIEDRSRIIYNDNITIRGIPLAAYDYQVNGKSAIEWVMDRYQITTNKDSGIVNDPNLWLAESNNLRYIVDLILKVVTVSMETQKIVNSLPRLEF